MIEDRKILFIVHEGSRTGAPMLLYFLLKWLKANTTLRFEILVLNGGPLVADFSILARTYILSDLTHEFSLVNKVRRRLGKRHNDEARIAMAVRKLAPKGYDVVYGNTVVTLPWLGAFKSVSQARCVCAVHELQYVIQWFYPDRDYVARALSGLDLIIAGSAAVAHTLEGRYGVTSELITVIHSFIDTDITPSSPSSIRDALNIPAAEFVIGGAGVAGLRKGTDLLVPIACKLRALRPELRFRFVWLGSGDQELLRLIQLDAEKCGIGDLITFVPHVATPNDYINMYDVFLLPSREDPFPLVALTAAYLEKPVIAFEDGGGIPELLREGAGYLVPFLDCDRAAWVLARLADDRAAIVATGQKASRLIVDGYTCDVIGPKVYGTLQIL